MTGRERALAALGGLRGDRIARYADLRHHALLQRLGGQGDALCQHVRALRAMGIDMSREPARAGSPDPKAVATLPLVESLRLVREAWARACDAAGDDLLVLLEFPYSIVGPILGGPRALDALASLGSSPVEAAAVLDGPTRLCSSLAEGIAEWGRVPAVLFMDDLAGNNGPLISPATLRALYFPRLREVLSVLARAGIRVLFHSDGDLGSIHRDILQAGASGLHPVEPVGGWGLERAAETSSVVLVGNGRLGRIGESPQAARAEGRRCRSFGDRHSAYFLAPAAEVSGEIPEENWLAFFEP